MALARRIRWWGLATLVVLCALSSRDRPAPTSRSPTASASRRRASTRRCVGQPELCSIRFRQQQLGHDVARRRPPDVDRRRREQRGRPEASREPPAEPVAGRLARTAERRRAELHGAVAEREVTSASPWVGATKCNLPYGSILVVEPRPRLHPTMADYQLDPTNHKLKDQASSPGPTSATRRRRPTPAAVVRT